MKYTKIDSVGKRVLAKELINWNSLEELIAIIEDIFLELSFVLIGNKPKVFRLQPDKAFVEIESLSMAENHKITLSYGIVNFSRIEIFSSYIFLHHTEDGGDVFSIHKVKDYNSITLKGKLENVLNLIFDDIRDCWKQSALTVGDFL